MSTNLLFANDSDSDDNECNLNTNKEYAKSYNKFRSKELLKKLKDKNQSTNASNSSDDSTSDSDSTDNEMVDPKFNEAFFQALATLKKRDSSTYDANVKFFDEFDRGKVGGEKRSEKALTVKDYERKILVERGGIYEDDDDEEENVMKKQSTSLSYNQEQINIKNAFKKVIDEEDDDDDEDNEWGGIFRKREKSKEEEANDEEQYVKWLAGEEANIGENAQKLKPLKEYWNNPKLSKDEKFLRDYILTNGYSRSDKNDIPTYDEIVGDDQLELSEDEAELERQAEFEQKFNFRFEEPDNEFIKRYPRTIEHSVRKEDNRRKEKRVEVKERKLKEKKEKMKELEILNAMKKREIEEKIQKLKEVTGNDDLPFDDDDIDGDFDPDKYDQKMQEIFNNEYYQVNEGDTKPDIPDIEELKFEDWDNYDPNKDEAEYEAGGGHCEDDDFNMDCDFSEQQKKSLQDELIENSRDKRKRRKKQSKFIEMLKREKPVFNPDDERTYGQYIDEYYKLDYEDIIGDTPCRFKYVETVPNDFGLTVEEILLAKNKELNQWASLKKATQIRPEHVELNEVKTFKNKATNDYLKRKILPSLYEEGSDDESSDAESKVENKKAATSGNKKKVNVSKKNIPSKTIPQEVNDTEMEIIQKDEKKLKPKKLSPVKKSFENTEKDTVTRVDERSKKVNKMTPSSPKVIGKANNKNDHQVKKMEIDEKPKIIKEVSLSTSKLQGKSTGKIEHRTKKNQPITKHGGNKANRQTGTLNKTIQKPKKNENSVSKGTYPNKPSISDERLRAFGLNPKKFHNKLKYGSKTTATTSTNAKNNVKGRSKSDKLNQKKNKRKLIAILGK